MGLLAVGWQWDAVQLWIGAHALLGGRDPYAAVPGAGFPWPLYYPLPAVLLAVPIAGLPETAARLVWAAATGVAFALGVRGPARAAALGAPFLVCLVLGHLAPAFMAGAAVPWLAALWVVKPSVGLALFVAYPSRQATIGGAALLVASLAVMPEWPLRWLDAIQTVPQKAPVVMPGGALLLLAWLRWRSPAGRLLGTLALVPHGPYDAVILWLACRRRWEGLGLAAFSLAGAFVSHALWPWEPGANVAQPEVWPITLATIYLPVLLLVLRSSSPTYRSGRTREVSCGRSSGVTTLAKVSSSTP